MASVYSNNANGHSESNGISTAQALKQQHDAHNPTVEEEVDEADLKHTREPISSSVLEGPDDDPSAPGLVPSSTKPAGKAPGKENRPKIDINSAGDFPSLGGGPKPVQTTPVASWGGKKPTAVNGSSKVSNGVPKPTPGVNAAHIKPMARPQVNIPGQARSEFELPKHEIMPREQLKKPISDLLKDINRKSKAKVSSSLSERGTLFTAVGPSKEAADQALQEVLSQIGAKLSRKVRIPRSARAHIIGKQGAKIKELQSRFGANIQIPKTEDAPSSFDEDEDAEIEILVEGNSRAVQATQQELERIASERAGPSTAKIRGIPAEFYPFISQNEKLAALEADRGVKLNVPSYTTWSSQPPPEESAPGEFPAFLPSAPDNHITLIGDRHAVQSMKADVESLAEHLRRQLAVNHVPIESHRRPYIIGNRGVPAETFFMDNGCAIIFPADADESDITIVGPPARLQAARSNAIKLAHEMQNSSIDMPRQLFKGIPNANSHAQNFARYLRQRKILEDLEALHEAHITPMIDTARLEIFGRDLNNMTNAKSEVAKLAHAHPPSRMRTVPVDPFFHRYLDTNVTPRVRQDFGVHVLIPETSEIDVPVLLVCEGPTSALPDFKVSRDKPTQDQIRMFEQNLGAVEKHILDLINAQSEIKSTTIDVPQMFHGKLRNFIKEEQQSRAEDQIPVRVSAAGTMVTLRGPAPSVDSLAVKVDTFVKQAIEDEKERGFTMSFEFPQKHANQLVGKSGKKISELREKFDVEINVKDGIVELRGPKAKAEAAKSHITKLGRQWADEKSITLIFDPQFHGLLKGSKGVNIERLTKDNSVQINFPRADRPTRDDQSNADAASEVGRRGPRPDQAPNQVLLRGPTKEVDAVKDELQNLYQYLQDTSYQQKIAVQRSQIPSLLGQGGKDMEALRLQTGATINVPNGNDGEDMIEIQIKGTKEQVNQAKKILEEKKKEFDNTVTRYFELEKRHVGALIGPGGQTCRSIIVEAGGSDDARERFRMVQFPKADTQDSKITVQGKQEVVDKIIAAFEAIVNDLKNRTTETIDVPTDKHRSLIGRGGDIKKGIESEFRVSLDIPRQDSGQTGVRIAGLPADVEKAKAHILELVKGQEGETIQVPQKYHHQISENGLFFRSLKNNHQVTVDHARQPLPPKPTTAPQTNGAAPLITDEQDPVVSSWHITSSAAGPEGSIPWVLRGPTPNVAKAKAAVLAAIAAASSQTHTGFLALQDPSTHKLIVGRNGSGVKRIRGETECKITIPREGGAEDAIVIVGSEDGVLRAREMILEAVKGNGGGRA